MALPVAPFCILAVSPGFSCLSCSEGLALWFCWLPLPFSRLWFHWPHPHPGKSHCLPMISWFEALVSLCQGSYSQASEFRMWAAWRAFTLPSSLPSDQSLGRALWEKVQKTFWLLRRRLKSMSLGAEPLELSGWARAPPPRCLLLHTLKPWFFFFLFLIENSFFHYTHTHTHFYGDRVSQCSPTYNIFLLQFPLPQLLPDPPWLFTHPHPNPFFLSLIRIQSSKK